MRDGPFCLARALTLLGDPYGYRVGKKGSIQNERNVARGEVLDVRSVK